MTVTRFQQLGAFVNDWNAMSEAQLQRFADAGGKWIVPLLAQLGYPDDHDPICVSNLSHIDGIIEACREKGIAVGGWFNGWAKSAASDAAQIKQIMRAHSFDGPIVLDCEAAYQWPDGRPQQLPQLVAEVRRLHPTRGIAVSTNSPNDSIIVNGGQLGHLKAFQHLGVRLMPQWYPWMGTWGDPVTSMQWAKTHGWEDNWHDPDGPGLRAVPLSYFHGTLEVTGLEGSVLAPQLDRLYEATKWGFTKGFSIYLLESAPAADFDLLAARKGQLFLV